MIGYRFVIHRRSKRIKRGRKKLLKIPSLPRKFGERGGVLVFLGYVQITTA